MNWAIAASSGYSEVRLRAASTPYARAGFLFGPVCLLGTVALLGILFVKRRS